MCSCSGSGSLVAVYIFAFLVSLTDAWQHSLPVKNSVRYETFNDDQIFYGNKNAKDYLKIILQDQRTALIGSRNVLYNISLDTMKENHRYYWNSSEADYEMCRLKGKSEDDCQNYIRIAFNQNDENMFVCGTNAFRPICKTFNSTDGTKGAEDTDGRGICPYDPSHNSTSIYAGDQLYSGTVADFSGSDPLIYKKPMRTERDFEQLNGPNFVGSLEYKDYVFFFFRETAVEYINCGKAVYSRVARVCKHDKGGPRSHRDRWTSFLKARLNCSVPGNYPFYFDEIQDTSDVLSTTALTGSGDPIVYGVFNTPVNAISGSAVCVFNVRDVIETFSGSFKGQETKDSNWLPVKEIPEPRPGTCVEDSRTLPNITVNFVKKYSLMDDAVPSLFPKPIFTRISSQSRLTSVAVDGQIAGLNEQLYYDILFLGTDDGRLVKGALHTHNGSPEFISIEEVNLTANNTKPFPVRTLNIIKSVGGQPGRIVATFDEHIISVPLDRCYLKTTCQECIDLQDPYCAWDGVNCVNHLEVNRLSKRHFVQSIGLTRNNDACPKENSDEKLTFSVSSDDVREKISELPVISLDNVIDLLMMIKALVEKVWPYKLLRKLSAISKLLNE